MATEHPPEVVSALELDPGLGRGIAADEWSQAHRICLAQLVHVAAGAWVPESAEVEDRDEPVAYVIVDGLVSRELSLGGNSMFELLGPTDVLQPPPLAGSAHDGPEARLAAVTASHVLVLRQPFLLAAAQWPSLLRAVWARLEVQRQNLAVQALITRLSPPAHRLLLTLGRLAARWGEVVTDGVLIPVALNGHILAGLTGARPPEIAAAVKELEGEGNASRRPDGYWLLTAKGRRTAKSIACAAQAPQLGDLLALRQRTSETYQETSALLSEAHQARARRIAVGADLQVTLAASRAASDRWSRRRAASLAGDGWAVLPPSLRRAVAFIERNPEASISVGDVAEAAGITPRALQYAFARHLSTTPLGYLRRTRLDLAHRELERSRSGDGTTVAQVARRWGFTSPSRFARAYRAAYGQRPKETLSSRSAADSSRGGDGAADLDGREDRTDGGGSPARATRAAGNP